MLRLSRHRRPSVLEWASRRLACKSQTEQLLQHGPERVGLLALQTFKARPTCSADSIQHGPIWHARFLDKRILNNISASRTYVQERRVLGLLALQNYCRVGFKEKNYYRVGRYEQRDKLLHN